jgi:hypothetical protein
MKGVPWHWIAGAVVIAGHVCWGVVGMMMVIGLVVRIIDFSRRLTTTQSVSIGLSHGVRTTRKVSRRLTATQSVHSLALGSPLRSFILLDQ